MPNHFQRFLWPQGGGDSLSFMGWLTLAPILRGRAHPPRSAQGASTRGDSSHSESNPTRIPGPRAGMPIRTPFELGSSIALRTDGEVVWLAWPPLLPLW